MDDPTFSSKPAGISITTCFLFVSWVSDLLLLFACLLYIHEKHKIKAGPLLMILIRIISFIFATLTTLTLLGSTPHHVAESLSTLDDTQIVDGETREAPEDASILPSWVSDAAEQDTKLIETLAKRLVEPEPEVPESEYSAIAEEFFRVRSKLGADLRPYEWDRKKSYLNRCHAAETGIMTAESIRPPAFYAVAEILVAEFEAFANIRISEIPHFPKELQTGIYNKVVKIADSMTSYIKKHSKLAPPYLDRIDSAVTKVRKATGLDAWDQILAKEKTRGLKEDVDSLFAEELAISNEQAKFNSEKKGQIAIFWNTIYFTSFGLSLLAARHIYINMAYIRGKYKSWFGKVELPDDESSDDDSATEVNRNQGKKKPKAIRKKKPDPDSAELSHKQNRSPDPVSNLRWYKNNRYCTMGMERPNFSGRQTTLLKVPELKQQTVAEERASLPPRTKVWKYEVGAKVDNHGNVNSAPEGQKPLDDPYLEAILQRVGDGNLITARPFQWILLTTRDHVKFSIQVQEQNGHETVLISSPGHLQDGSKIIPVNRRKCVIHFE